MAAAATAEHRPSEGTRGSRPTSCSSESEAASHAIAPGGGVGRQPARLKAGLFCPCLRLFLFARLVHVRSGHVVPPRPR